MLLCKCNGGIRSAVGISAGGCEFFLSALSPAHNSALRSAKRAECPFPPRQKHGDRMSVPGGTECRCGSAAAVAGKAFDDSSSVKNYFRRGSRSC